MAGTEEIEQEYFQRGLLLMINQALSSPRRRGSIFSNLFLMSLCCFFISSCAEFSDVLGVEAKSSNSNIKKERHYIVHQDETLSEIASQFDIEVNQLADRNNITEADHLEEGQVIIIHQKKETLDYRRDLRAKKEDALKVEENAPTETEDENHITFHWPVRGEIISPFGPRRNRAHDGIDIGAKIGVPVYAAANGEVIFAGKLRAYGNLVILKHRSRYFTAYAHLNEIKTKKWKKLTRGELLGTVGRTGRATAPHLHFEVRHKTGPLDPLKFLPPKN